VFLVGTVGVAVTLAAVVKYNVTVKAPAIVRPAGDVRIVQAPIEGTVTRISVKENQIVKQGDAIATLDDSQLQTKKSQLIGSIQNSKQQFAQIAAQVNELNRQQIAESSLMNRTVASAQADLSRQQRDYQDRQTITQSDVKEAEASLELARAQMAQYQQLRNTGAVAQLQIKEKEEAFKAAQARLERTQAALNPSTASVAIATEQIAQARARGESTLATLNKERESLLQRQVEIQNQINRDTRELQQLEIELSKTVIRSPASGTILKLALRNPSQVVRPGDAIAQIAPNNASLVIKARVAAQDIGKVKVCKLEKVRDCAEGKVQLRVSAYPYPDYGTLKGAVKAIAPDSITSQSNTPSVAGAIATGAADSYYEITIQPERPYLVKDKRQYPIQPGMEATADIIAKEETVLTFMLRRTRLLTDL
jgi:HlyD family type I secretion membrane fusion protein